MKNQIFFLDTIEFILRSGDVSYGHLPDVDVVTRIQGRGQEMFILPAAVDAKDF